MKARKILLVFLIFYVGHIQAQEHTGFGKNLFQTRVFRIGTIP